MVTLGKGGCAYWHDGSIRYVSAIDEFRAVDTTGAGDNFLTGIIYGLLTEEPLDAVCGWGTSSRVSPPRRWAALARR